MMTNVKKIPAFFLFLAAAVFYAHIIIPHDHHTADSDAYQDNRCPVTDNHKSHHKSFPVHCHAFNDLTSEKAIIHIFIQHVQYRDFTPPSAFNSVVTNLSLSSTRLFDLFKQADNSGITELPVLRAPPSLS